ncbi:MAG: hypothetical protein PHY47_01175 [Lachnospiraceae bacterium]|nr:hypothetical protein [Lachnospiraceae bacterium]
MVEIKGNRSVYFDVDDTLVDWNQSHSEDALAFNNNGYIEMLKPKWDIIKKLKEHKRNGDTIIVWSQNGWDWCKEVVTTLSIESYVDAVITKPDIYYDDLNCKEFMKNWIKA